MGAVDCDAHKKLCDDYGVTSHPTLKVIPPNAFGIQDYTGERNTKAVFSWAVRFMTHFVEKVNADNLDGFLNAQVTIFFVPLSPSYSLTLPSPSPSRPISALVSQPLGITIILIHLLSFSLHCFDPVLFWPRSQSLHVREREVGGQGSREILASLFMGRAARSKG